MMGRAVPAANRALDILELFLETPVLSAPEVVARLGLPRTTVHELLGTLVDRGYLVLMPGQPLRYRLGARLFQLGSVFAESVDLPREAQRAAAEVAGACDETVHVAVLDGRDVFYIARVDSTHPVRMVSAVGRRLPAHCTGVGKMLLSSLPPDAIDALYPSGTPLETMTSRSISSRSKLNSALSRIRRAGLSFDQGESTKDVNCVAAGVHDHTGHMVAAMSISVPSTRWDAAARATLPTLVRQGAERLSENLGYVPDRAAAAGRTAPDRVRG
jgi:DNA-binding IclR family transcriptional regulator